MKIISFLGSPRKQGNTAALLNKVLQGACSNPNVESETIFLEEENINPCMGCNSCKKSENLKCVIKDDMQKIYTKIEDADLIIIATPIYWWSVTAQTKTLVDRFYGMNFKSPNLNLEDKKIMLLMTYGGALPNSGPERVELNFKEICDYMKISVAGVLGVCTEKIEVSNNEQALKEAYNLGRNVL